MFACQTLPGHATATRLLIPRLSTAISRFLTACPPQYEIRVPDHILYRDYLRTARRLIATHFPQHPTLEREWSAVLGWFLDWVNEEWFPIDFDLIDQMDGLYMQTDDSGYISYFLETIPYLEFALKDVMNLGIDLYDQRPGLYIIRMMFDHEFCSPFDDVEPIELSEREPNYKFLTETDFSHYPEPLKWLNEFVKMVTFEETNIFLTTEITNLQYNEDPCYIRYGWDSAPFLRQQWQEAKPTVDHLLAFEKWLAEPADQTLTLLSSFEDDFSTNAELFIAIVRNHRIVDSF